MIQTAGKLAIEILEKFPNAPTKTLARILYEQHPKAFLSLESARTRIRYYRGSHGGNNRKILGTKKYIRKFDESMWNPFGLPESDAEDYPPYIVPLSYKRHLLIADFHLPYHDIEAITAMIKFTKEHKPQTIIIDGDFFDFYQLSRFVKDPRKKDIAGELETGKKILDILDKEFNAHIYFKPANHEARMERYLKVKAPELLGLAEFELQNLLEFGRRGIELVDSERIVKLGKLSIVHGEEFQSRATGQVNPARTLFLKTKKSAICAHSHITSEHSETDIDGKPIATWSIGCLCGLWPEWARINKWNHGFAVIETDDDGGFVVENKRIYKGRIF